MRIFNVENKRWLTNRVDRLKTRNHLTIDIEYEKSIFVQRKKPEGKCSQIFRRISSSFGGKLFDQIRRSRRKKQRKKRNRNFSRFLSEEKFHRFPEFARRSEKPFRQFDRFDKIDQRIFVDFVRMFDSFLLEELFENEVLSKNIESIVRPVRFSATRISARRATTVSICLVEIGSKFVDFRRETKFFQRNFFFFFFSAENKTKNFVSISENRVEFSLMIIVVALIFLMTISICLFLVDRKFVVGKQIDGRSLIEMKTCQWSKEKKKSLYDVQHRQEEFFRIPSPVEFRTNSKRIFFIG